MLSVTSMKKLPETVVDEFRVAEDTKKSSWIYHLVQDSHIIDHTPNPSPQVHRDNTPPSRKVWFNAVLAA